MHKKLETDLISLAHSLLQMKNKEDVFALKEKAYEIYEKLAVLAYIEEYINTTPNTKETKATLVAKVEKAIEQKQEAAKPIEEKQTVIPLLDVKIDDEIIEDKDEIIQEKKEISNKEKEIIQEEIIEQPFDEIEGLLFSNDAIKNDVKDVGERKTLTLEEELENTIPVDVMANLFDNAVPKSLNDRLQTSIQIGLNDRIAFVKNLFNGSQEDFNKVVSQLNTFKTENEAKKFINKIVKPSYNWSEQEDVEARFIEIIERRFA